MSHHKRDKHVRSQEQQQKVEDPTANPPITPTGATGQPGDQNPNAASGFQEHDALHRQGSFEGRGEHARTGNPGHQ